jgi:hypothetical protein
MLFLQRVRQPGGASTASSAAARVCKQVHALLAKETFRPTWQMPPADEAWSVCHNERAKYVWARAQKTVHKVFTFTKPSASHTRWKEMGCALPRDVGVMRQLSALAKV